MESPHLPHDKSSCNWTSRKINRRLTLGNLSSIGSAGRRLGASPGQSPAGPGWPLPESPLSRGDAACRLGASAHAHPRAWACSELSLHRNDCDIRGAQWKPEMLPGGVAGVSLRTASRPVNTESKGLADPERERAGLRGGDGGFLATQPSCLPPRADDTGFLPGSCPFPGDTG